jgi:hypothetical protein
MFIKRKHFSRLLVALSLSLPLLTSLQQSLSAQNGPCTFASTSKISSRDQAKCLLAPVRIYGNRGSTLSNLPPTLNRMLGLLSIDLDKETLRRYLIKSNIQEGDIGGSLDQPVSRANNNGLNADLARYFIIHDTSTPNFGDGKFPEDINEPSWSGNNLKQWTRSPFLAHVFVSRVGSSVTPVDFGTPWRSTGYEVDFCGVPCKGLFLSVEMVQPRQSDSQGRSANDAIAPTPGFTEAQLDRLALVYIAASVRRGKWMIPAFHAGIDAQIYGDHDDPQNFDLQLWDERLKGLLAEIQS